MHIAYLHTSSSKIDQIFTQASNRIGYRAGLVPHGQNYKSEKHMRRMNNSKSRVKAIGNTFHHQAQRKMQDQQKEPCRKIVIEPGVTTQKYTAHGKAASRISNTHLIPANSILF